MFQKVSMTTAVLLGVCIFSASLGAVKRVRTVLDDDNISGTASQADKVGSYEYDEEKGTFVFVVDTKQETTPNPLLVSGIFKIGNTTFMLICSANSMHFEIVEVSDNQSIGVRPISGISTINLGSAFRSDARGPIV